MERELRVITSGEGRMLDVGTQEEEERETGCGTEITADQRR